MKKSKKTITVDEISTSQPQVTNEETTVKSLGRPVVPGSKRQQQIAAKQAAIAAGNPPHRGRKADPNSKRQIRLAELEEKKAAGLLTGERGRPVNPNSKHQQALAEKQARIDANGGEVPKPGRPPYTAEQKAAAEAAKAAKIAEQKAMAKIDESIS